MEILTDGSRFVFPTPSRARPGEPVRYSLVRRALAAARCAQWWGCFRAGDVLQLELRTSRPAQVDVALLDSCFQPLSQLHEHLQRARLEATTRREGIVYLRVANRGARPVGIELELTRRRRSVAIVSIQTPNRPRVRLLGRWRAAA